MQYAQRKLPINWQRLKTRIEHLRLLVISLRKVQVRYLKLTRRTAAAEISGLATPLLKRLKFDEEKLNDVCNGIDSLITLDDPVNKLMLHTTLDDGLELYKVSCSMGVIELFSSLVLMHSYRLLRSALKVVTQYSLRVVQRLVTPMTC